MKKGKIKKKMEFFMPMIPPTVTDQEHKIGKKKNGDTYIYKDKKLSEARAKIKAALVPHTTKLREPLKGALFLRVVWCFPSKTHKSGSWKTSKPDTDNLNKMLKDVMTELRFWNDDAQVAMEEIQKRWVDGSKDLPGIYIDIEEM